MCRLSKLGSFSSPRPSVRAGWLLLSVYMKSIYSAPSGDIVEACEKERASESLEESLFTFYFFSLGRTTAKNYYCYYYYHFVVALVVVVVTVLFLWFVFFFLRHDNLENDT